jgi:hypothetical protein
MLKNIRKIAFLFVLLASCVFSFLPVVHAAVELANVEKPIITIRFNQEHVYIKEALKKIVSEVEQAKAGAIYEVRSVSPSALRGNRTGEMRVRAILEELGRLGVSSDRLSSEEQYSDNIKSQEVRIFVR